MGHSTKDDGIPSREKLELIRRLHHDLSAAKWQLDFDFDQIGWKNPGYFAPLSVIYQTFARNPSPWQPNRKMKCKDSLLMWVYFDI